MFKLLWTDEARDTYVKLQQDQSQKKRSRAVKKAIELLAHDPRHNSLQTHQYLSLSGPDGEKVFEAYAEQRTPAAYRIFWYYGPERNMITILAITPHP